MIYSTADFPSPKNSYTPKNIKENDPTLIPPTRVPGQKIFTGGVKDSSGTEIKMARMWRERGPSAPPHNVISLENATKQDPKKHLYGDYTYLGVLYNQYGHFLLESLSRVPIKREDRIRTVCFSLYNKQPSYIDYMLRAIGINPLYIKETTKIHGTITIPNPRIIIRSYFDPSQYKIYQEIKNYTLDNSRNNEEKYPKMLYLSRSKLLNDKRKILNEIEIERYFSNRGFEICHMQNVPFNEQILLMHNAEVVVGFMGSAMHSLVFCNKSIRAVILYAEEKVNQNYIYCDEMIGRSSIYIDISSFLKNKNVEMKKLKTILDYSI